MIVGMSQGARTALISALAHREALAFQIVHTCFIPQSTESKSLVHKVSGSQPPLAWSAPMNINSHVESLLIFLLLVGHFSIIA